MKQVVQNVRSGKLQLVDVPKPNVKPGHVLVRTRASLISPGTERMLMDFAKKSMLGKAQERPDLVKKVLNKAKRDGLKATFEATMARLSEPLPLGYSAAGEITAVGAGLEGLWQVGQRVSVAGAGLANHAEVNLVPANLVAPIPDKVPFDAACYGTMGAIAMHSVRNLKVGLGDFVGILGVGLLGQIATRLLALQGARVIALDYDDLRLDLAKAGGAEAALNLASVSIEEGVAALTGGLGCDALLIAAATSSSEPLQTAAAVARDRAQVVMVGKTGTEFPYGDFMKKELTITVSRSYGPGRYDDAYEMGGMLYPPGYVRWTETANLKEVVRLMGSRTGQRLDVAPLTTHRFSIHEAEAAYGEIAAGKSSYLGVVLEFADDFSDSIVPLTPRKVAANDKATCVLGVVGAGNFARTTLLPSLKRVPSVALHTIVTQRGTSAAHTQDEFGFQHAAADIQAILANEAINGVLILTRHASHAPLTVKALQAGKSVFVEKPLALTRDELNAVIEARNHSDGFVLVGFNRRFSPFALQAREELEKSQGAIVGQFRVNAGPLPFESWVNAPDEGGGRLLGELCHFIDLARYLVDAPIVEINARAAATGASVSDDVAINLSFADGSLVAIIYTGLGDASFSKERFELYRSGSVVVIDNFQSLTVTRNGKTRTSKALSGQDKGHFSEMKAFVDGVTAGRAPVDEQDLIESSVATIAVLESLQCGQAVRL